MENRWIFYVFGNLWDVNLKENNMDLLKKLFYPDYFSNDTNKKIKQFENWYEHKLPVYLVGVNFMRYKFTNKGASKEDFHKNFIKAAKNYHVLKR